MSRDLPLVAIDAHRLTCEPNTSGSHYLGGMLREWVTTGTPCRFALFLPRTWDGEGELGGVIGSPNVRVVVPKKFARPTSSYRAQVWWQQVHIPQLISSIQPTLYFSPFHLTPLMPFRVPVVSTVHDLCFLSEPFLSVGHFVHRIQINSACLRADALICVSQFTYDTLTRWAPRAAMKASVVPNGVQGRPVPQVEAVEIIKRAAVPAFPFQYFMWVGNPIQARKNIPVLLRAFDEHLKVHPAHRLVMVVPQAARQALLESEATKRLGRALILLSSVSELLRDALYACALALVFPSSCEGFGFPVLEAMVQGCPPIASATGPASEIVGESVPLSCDFRVESFVHLMQMHAAVSEDKRTIVAERVRRRAELFSVKRMAQGTFSVFSRLLGQ